MTAIMRITLVWAMTLAGVAAGAGAASPALALDMGRDWRASDWPAGQSALVRWSPDQVRPGPEGVQIVLDRNPAAAAGGAARPYLGGEIQSVGRAEGGLWAFRARVPQMVDGAVFGMFLYRADHAADPWREYDIEFVGGDTRVVELNIHFEDAAGKHVSLTEGPVRVDLPFDAAAGFHDYEIEVQPDRAIFRIDGAVVGEFGPDDMPGQIWSNGPLKAFVDLWAVAPAQEAWAGRWAWPGRPLIATLSAARVPPMAD